MLDSGRTVSRGWAFRPFRVGSIPKLGIRRASSVASARVLHGAVEGLFRFRKADCRPGVLWFSVSNSSLGPRGERRALFTG